MRALLERADLESVIAVLRRRGHTLIGPVVRDGAIVCAEFESLDDLPAGWVEEQEAGRYRLRQTGDPALFDHTVGPASWKRFLFPPAVRLVQAGLNGQGPPPISGGEADEPPRYAFIGVRGCDLAAIAVQDAVLLGQAYVDRAYESRRRGAFILAVHCGRPSATCFCASMGTGPRAGAGFDLALTEVCGDGRHYFIVETGSPLGMEILGEVPHREARPAECAAAEAVVARAAGLIGRRVDREGLKDLLYRSSEHPRWDEVAVRCLACANCTMVCPTCFCTSAADRSDLDGTAERWRCWDSCFSGAFSYIHGGSIRASTRSRYRQWLVHKFASWIDQFGTAGCVGCGRCITWCPAAIDVTEEIRAIRGQEVAVHGDA